MDHNPVKTLPPRAFHLTGLINVQKVFLKNCSLNDLDPTALAGLVILIELDLSENKIKELKQGTFQVRYSGIYAIVYGWSTSIIVLFMRDLVLQKHTDCAFENFKYNS